MLFFLFIMLLLIMVGECVIIVYLALAIIPSVLIGMYLYKKDRNKESKGILIKLFLGGVASCFLTLLITILVQVIIPGLIPSSEEAANTNIFWLFIQVMLGVALIEEFSKWFFAYFIGYKNKEFDEMYDMLLYCGFVALGFATFENILYVFTAENSMITALLRAITAVPGHVCDAIFMGFYLGLAKQHKMNGTGNTTKYLLLSIFVPMITHGIYDFLIMSGSGLFVLVWFGFVIGIYIYVIKKIRQVSREQKTIYHPVDGMVANPYMNNMNYYPQNNTFGMNSMYNQQPGYNNQLPNNYPNPAVNNTNVNHVIISYCPNCGNYEPTNNFCTKCGTKMR